MIRLSKQSNAVLYGRVATKEQISESPKFRFAAAYIRVSTDDQDELSPESQLDEIRKYAKREGIILLEDCIYIEEPISGRKAKNRPKFQEMIARAKESDCPFSVILLWKFARFARNQEESIFYKSILRSKCKVDVVSITEPLIAGPFGKLIERIIEWMDEFYSIRLGQEVRSKMTFVAEKGLPQTVASFGYSKKPDQELKIVPEEAVWVKFMAESLLQGRSLRWISNQINEHGIRTHRGSKFEPRTIEYILRNITNAGAIHWTPNQDDHDGRQPYSENTIIVKDACPAIYSYDYYEALVAELDRRAASRKKYSKPDTVRRHWLSGFLKCSNCGSSMVYQRANNGFQCYKYGKSLCTVSHYISAPKIEAAVIDALSRVTVTEDFIQSITRPASNNAPDYSKDVERLERMLDRAKLAYVEGIDTMEEYAANKNRILAEMDIYQKKQDEQKSSIICPNTDDVRRQFKSVTDLIRSDADDDAKRTAFGSIVEKVVYSKPDDSVSIFFYL